MNETNELRFGRYQLRRRQRQLLMNGAPIELGARAIDILLELIDAGGAPVSKDKLIDRVWAGIAVEEQNLIVQIHALRKALGSDRDLIRTVPRHGYSFTGKVEILPTPQPAKAVVAAPGPVAATNVPMPIEALIGRDDEVQELLDLQARCRLLTLAGPGGIGKTRLALEVARRLLPSFSDGVWLAELAPLSDGASVLAAIASALGVQPGALAPSHKAMAAALAEKKFLLVLDNCEHVISDAARCAEALLNAAPEGCIFATSREPLGAAGETVYRVPALAAPGAREIETEAILRHGAVELFIFRAQAAGTRLQLGDNELATIATICRRLDGIPLAIELAAVRVPALGLEELLDALDDRFELLIGGRRTALPRHQTLQATLDWSFDLLTERERVVLRRLAVFVGGFTLHAANAVVFSAGASAAEVVESLANLVSKSLVAVSAGGIKPRYRLLETTRVYALEKLTASGEFETVARRHAAFFRDFLERVEPQQRERSMPERLVDYTHEINDVRAALDWAFSPAGDAALGVALTVASEHLWFAMSLMDECRRRFESALSTLRAEMGGDPRLQMRLWAAIGAALYYTKGPCPEACAAWTDVLAMAERLGATEYRLRALWGLVSHHLGSGELRAALALAQRFASLPPDQAGPTDLLVGERLLAATMQFMGDLGNARRHLEHVLSRFPASMTQLHPPSIRFEWSRSSSARGSLIPILWLQGFPDQAMLMAQAYVEEAQATGHPISLCWALYAACPAALVIGDLMNAERYVTILRAHSARHAPGFLQAQADGFQGELLIRRGDAVGGVQCLRIALDELRASGFVLRRPALLGALAEGLVAAGDVAEGLLAINEALAQCERSEERWNMAELLRVKGELLLLEGTQEAAAAAEHQFLQALNWARRQGALFWELRCATSLARLRKEQGRISEAGELLTGVYDRFTEGFETANLKTARELLDSLRDFPPSARVTDGDRLPRRPANRRINDDVAPPR